MEVQKILDERQKTHGEFRDNARIAQRLKTLFKTGPVRFTDVQEEALDMICCKLARIMSNPSHADHGMTSPDTLHSLQTKFETTNQHQMSSPQTILVSEILIGPRVRDTTKYGDIDGLKSSLTTYGSIHPILLHIREDGKPELIAGGRRLRAIKSIGVEKLYKNSVLNPDRLGYSLASEQSEAQRKELELEENLRRLQMDWIDSVLAIADIHQINKAKDPSWGQRQTAELLNQKGGVAKVNYCIRTAKALRAKDEEVLSCTSLDQALQVFARRKEEEGISELQRRTAKKLGTISPAATKPGHEGGVATKGTGGPTADLLKTLSLLGQEAQEPNKTSLTPSHTPQSYQPKLTIPLSSMFALRDSILDDTPWPVVNHIVTDIPYGIDMENLDDKQVASVKESHGVEDNIALMLPFLQKAFVAVKPYGFCVFFYDLDHHEKLQAWAQEVGWRVQRWPYIAVKTSASRNQAAQYNTTKNYETAMLLRRDDKTVLRSAVPSSWKPYDFKVERELYNNPFAKPSALWKDIYDMISFSGQSVLDPFCGEMSACRAAANSGLVPYGIEKYKQHFERGIHHMRNIYNLIHKNNCEFV